MASWRQAACANRRGRVQVQEFLARCGIVTFELLYERVSCEEDGKYEIVLKVRPL